MYTIDGVQAVDRPGSRRVEAETARSWSSRHEQDQQRPHAVEAEALHTSR